jgi:peroxiredoxin
VALVSLWATWCDACVQEIDALGRLDERVRALGGAVVAVDEGEPLHTVRAFVQQRGLRYAQLIDEELRLGDALGNKRVPTTLVVDRSGRIAYLGGALDEPALAALRAVLAAPAVAKR